MCNDEVEEQPEPNIVGYAIIILIILAATTKDPNDHQGQRVWAR